MDEAYTKASGGAAHREGAVEDEGAAETKPPSKMTQLLAAHGLYEGSTGGDAQGVAVIKDTGARVRKFGEHEAATHIQAAYRGSATRRTVRGNLKGGHSRQDEATSQGPALDSSVPEPIVHPVGDETAGPAALQEAEEALTRCLRATRGVGPPPDLRPTFAALDREGKGTVNRKQFAHALRQHSGLIALSPLHLRVFMDHFDTSTDGTAIDYHAFLVFAGE